MTGARRPADDRRVSKPVLAVGLAVVWGTAAQLLFMEHGPGINVLLAVSGVLAAAFAIRPRERSIDRRDLWIPAAALLFAVFCAIRADVLLLTFDVSAATALTIASVVVLSGVRVMDLPAGGVLGEALRSLGHVLGKGGAVAGQAWPRLRPFYGARAAQAAGYLGGLLIALPFLLLFGALFGAADEVFAKTLGDVFDTDVWLERLGELPWRIAFGVLGAWVAAGAFARLHRPPPAVAREPGRGWLSPEPALVALLAIDALFAAFVLTQLAYLFGGRDTLEAATITYSAYARRGFFELITVTALVAMLLFAAELAVRRRGRAYLMAALGLLVMTGVILVSAYYRLYLYQQAYGWTEQRFYALAMIGFLAVVLGILAWCVVTERMRYAIQPIVIAVLAAGAFVNVAAPSEFIVRANVARSLDPTGLPYDAQTRLDVWTLASLGPGAVPVLVDLLPSLPEPEQRQLRDALSYQRWGHVTSWQSWNLDRERARHAHALYTRHAMP